VNNFASIMNTPFSPKAWQQLQDHAAAQLSPNFADKVLRAARNVPNDVGSVRGWANNPILVSLATAAVCLASLLFVHTRVTDKASARHLADWRDIAVQVASLEPNP
jgi:hypothetical protein